MVGIELIVPAFVAGLLTFLAPCTLPMVPAYLGFISGVSARDMQGTMNARVRSRVFGNGLAFVLGFSTIFIVLGVFAGSIGHVLPGYHAFLTRIGGAFVILFGLFMLGVLRIPSLTREYRMHLAPSSGRGRYLNAFALGAAFGTGWTPCIGPVLGSILLLAATQGSTLSGAFLLGVFSLGLSIPFLLSALALGTAEKGIARLTPYLEMISRGGGILLIVLGSLLFTDTMSRFTGYAYTFLSFLHYDALLRFF